jgi:O-antigen/teichoic acid export membrane protein
VFIGSATGLAMAYYGYGVWSLVGLQLITQLTTSILIWSKANWTPQWAFSFTRIKYHWSFGYKLLLSSLLNVTFTEVYSVLIGKRFSVQSLGYYNRAKTYNSYPVDLISQVVSKVSYPLLSKMKEDKEGVSRTYQSILRSIFFIVTPLMFTLCVLAKPIFLLLFTEKWLDAVPYFQIMTISSILYPVHSFNLNVFKVFDRTDLYLKIALIRQGMVACVVALGLIFDIYTLLWGMVTISYIALFVNTYYSEKFIGYKTIKQIRDMAPTFLTAGGSAILGWYILSLMPEYNFLVQIFSVSIIITGVYVGLNVILKNQALHEFKSYLLFMIKKG